MSARLQSNGLAYSLRALPEAGRGTEERLLARARSRDSAAFRELVRLHQAAVYSLALRMLGLPEDAQELAQDVFLLLHRNLGSITCAAHLRHWLRRVACHRAIDRLRSRQAPPMLPLDAAAAIEDPRAPTAATTELQLGHLLARLQPMARAVILLRYQEDFDPPDIARVLGLPLNTVKSHLRRSLALLRQRCAHWESAR